MKYMLQGAEEGLTQESERDLGGRADSATLQEVRNLWCHVLSPIWGLSHHDFKFSPHSEWPVQPTTSICDVSKWVAWAQATKLSHKALPRLEHTEYQNARAEKSTELIQSHSQGFQDDKT